MTETEERRDPGPASEPSEEPSHEGPDRERRPDTEPAPDVP